MVSAGIGDFIKALNAIGITVPDRCLEFSISVKPNALVIMECKIMVSTNLNQDGELPTEVKRFYLVEETND